MEAGDDTQGGVARRTEFVSVVEARAGRCSRPPPRLGRRVRASYVWNDMPSDRVALVTPFLFGRHDLPTPSQVATICGHTTRAFLASCAGRLPLEVTPDVADMVNQVVVDIRSLKAAPGHICLRKRRASTGWG